MKELVETEQGKVKVEIIKPEPDYQFGISHIFDVGMAQKYGVNEAIILNNLIFWIKKNMANNKHFYDGYYWTYNSIKAFHELLPYLSEKQIRNALKNLEDKQVIITGNYNKVAYDRTLWYSIKDNSILQKGKMNFNEKSNGNIEKGEPIPYINTDNKTDNNINCDVSNETITTPKLTKPKKESKELTIYPSTDTTWKGVIEDYNKAYFFFSNKQYEFNGKDFKALKDLVKLYEKYNHIIPKVYINEATQKNFYWFVIELMERLATDKFYHNGTNFLIVPEPQLLVKKINYILMIERRGE